MKHSNKLLIALLTITLIVVLGNNLVTKAAYDKINPDDLFYGYKTQPLKPFKVVVLNGNVNGFVEIQAGKTSEIKTHSNFEKFITQKISGDTLHISLMYPERGAHFETDYTGFGPTIHIETPTVSDMYVNDISCLLKGFKTKNLAIHGQTGYTRLEDNTIENLAVVYKNGSFLQMNKNILAHAVIEIRDSSKFEVGKDRFTSLDFKVDSTATLSIPGALLAQFSKK
jgi:hypothetical protein